MVKGNASDEQSKMKQQKAYRKKGGILWAREREKEREWLRER